MAFARWISRAYRLCLNKLTRSPSGQVPRGYVILAAIVVGGVVAAGAVSNSFGRRAERTYQGSIDQLAGNEIDVTVIDPAPHSAVIPAARQFDMLALQRKLLMLASSASSVDVLTGIDSLTNIDTLTT